MSSTITQPQTLTPIVVTDLNSGTITIPQLDPSVRTLQDVKISVTGSQSGSVGVENLPRRRHLRRLRRPT